MTFFNISIFILCMVIQGSGISGAIVGGVLVPEQEGLGNIGAEINRPGTNIDVRSTSSGSSA
jgi:hypothetical protein